MIGAAVRIPELLIEQLTKFEFVIHRKTAKQIGLTIHRMSWRERIRS
jgi:hypothetical protein